MRAHVAVPLIAIVVLLMLPLTARGQTPASAPCCSVTAIDPLTGIVKARDASGQTFAFKVRDSWRLKSLKVGQKVYADFGKKMVAIQAGDFCCDIVELVTSTPRTGDACGEPVQQRALADTCALQYTSKIEEYKLKQRYDRLQVLLANVNADRGYYQGAIASCAIVDIGMKLLEHAAEKVATTPPRGVSAEQAKYLKDYGEAVEQIRTRVPMLIDRDPRVVAPEQVNETFEKLELVSGLFNAARITPAKMAAKIDECAGKVPPDMYDHAKRYVTNLQEMVRQAATLAVYRNNMRGKAQECWDLQAKYYPLCVDWARCKGADPQRQCKAPDR
jgi:hypothetical protein